METLTHDKSPEQSAGWRGPECMIPFAKTLIIRERRRAEGAIIGEWDGNLSRDIDLLLVVEDFLTEYLSEGRRHGCG
ncbi:MAG: hypothetical protein IH977_15305 [Nitrospinae bacterium]|nr:hypothetical protein [Nitrospinota bacterium]